MDRSQILRKMQIDAATLMRIRATLMACELIEGEVIPAEWLLFFRKMQLNADMAFAVRSVDIRYTFESVRFFIERYRTPTERVPNVYRTLKGDNHAKAPIDQT